jgi:hypothetical protein
MYSSLNIAIHVIAITCLASLYTNTTILDSVNIDRMIY